MPSSLPKTCSLVRVGSRDGLLYTTPLPVLYPVEFICVLATEESVGDVNWGAVAQAFSSRFEVLSFYTARTRGRHLARPTGLRAALAGMGLLAIFKMREHDAVRDQRAS